MISELLLEKSKKNKKFIKTLLFSIKRQGMEKMFQYLVKKGFFNSPASCYYHGNFYGGLAEHSINVYKLFSSMCKKFNVVIHDDTIIIPSILHDVCKIGLYVFTEEGIRYNSKHPKGHCKLSLERIEKFIRLKPLERKMIEYHMGMYGTYGISKCPEYTLDELRIAFNNRIVKLFYFCDEMSSQFLEV